VKILLVAPQPFYTERGTPIAVRLLVEALCELGHTVDLLVYHQGQDIRVDNMRLVRACRPPWIREVPIGISVAKLLCDAMLVYRMIGLLRRNHYDVIHAVEEAVFPGAVLSRFARCRLIYDMDSCLSDQVVDKWRVLKPLRSIFEWLERLAVRRAAATLAVCEDLAAKVRPWVGEGRVMVLPDVPLASERHEVESLRANTTPDTIVGLYVGNLEHYQGIDLLLGGVARLPRDLKLRVVVIGGDGKDLERYRGQASELGIADRIHFLGSRPVAHLGSYLAQADVLVSPRTLGVNTPMKVYSYMQSGKAILATDIRSHTQALDANCALLVAADPAAMASGLERLTRDSQLREGLGEAARAKADREYSHVAFKRRLQYAYEQLVKA
jgi:glycosyltransferase involved in cell wall biosynthesis